MAHRDDNGVGPGANDNASGTAALLELARAYARPSRGDRGRGRRLAHDRVPLHRRGLVRRARRGPVRGDVAVPRPHRRGRSTSTRSPAAAPPRLELAGDRPRSPAPALVATAAHRILENGGDWPEHAGFLGQLIDLGFPFTLYEQGPFLARGMSALTLTTGREPPAAGVLRPAAAAAADAAPPARARRAGDGRLARPGPRARAGDAELRLDREPRDPGLGGRARPDRAADPVPRRRDRPVRLLPAAADPARAGGARAAEPALLLALRRARVRGLPRPRRVARTGRRGRRTRPRRSPATGRCSRSSACCSSCSRAGSSRGTGSSRAAPIAAEEEIAGQAVALLALGIVGMLIVATNPFALVFALPALHIWLWLPMIRPARTPARIAVFCAGLVGPLLVLGSLAWRFGLGLDAPWYLLELVGVGYIPTIAVAITLAGAAAGAQLAASAAGRYAPYPDAREREAARPAARARPGHRPRRAAAAARAASSGAAPSAELRARGTGPRFRPRARPRRAGRARARRRRPRGRSCATPGRSAPRARPRRPRRGRARGASESRAAVRRTAAARRPGRNAGPGSAAPCSASSAGRTKSSKPTSAETGLPGSPNTSVAPRTPNEIGFPGRTATRQKTSSTPSSAPAARTRSCSPTETPPVVTSTSASSPRATAFRVAASSSLTRGSRSTSAPAERACASSTSPFAS